MQPRILGVGGGVRQSWPASILLDILHWVEVFLYLRSMDPGKTCFVESQPSALLDASKRTDPCRFVFSQGLT